jgi:6-pyruvoyltetrahydropterin/6-carboxytetrahydropterin synthase
LDVNNWVVDFGGLKGLKEIVREQFDHTTCIAADDPVLPIFEKLVQADACDLRVMPNGTGIERIAEWCYLAANKFVAGMTDNRCSCVKVEVFEHENNSAVYSTPKELFAPATKKAVTQEEVKGRQKDLTKPPFKDAIEGAKKGGKDGVVGSTVPVEEEKKKDVGVPLYPKKQTNKWLNPDSTWGI